MNNERYRELEGVLADIIDRQTDYAERHPDAGDSYAHLVADDYVYHGGRESLLEYCKEQKISLPEGFDMDALEDELISLSEPVPGSIFGAFGHSEWFVVSAFPVGEHEIQFSYSDFEEYCTPEEYEKFLGEVQKDNNFCLHGELAYVASDAVWFYVLEPQKIVGAIKDHTREPGRPQTPGCMAGRQREGHGKD